MSKSFTCCLSCSVPAAVGLQLHLVPADAEQDLRYSLVPAQEGNRIVLTPHHIAPMEAVTEQTFIAAVGAVTRLSVTYSMVRHGHVTQLSHISGLVRHRQHTKTVVRD